MKTRELFNLSEKIAIVTGGGRGLGEQMAKGLAEAGATVVVCSRKLNNCEDTANEIIKAGGRALAIACDVSKEDQVIEMVKVVERQYGNIDILINNAGVSWGATIEETTLKAWNRLHDVNNLGTFLCCREVGPIMKRQNKGKILNLSSISGMLGVNPEFIQAPAYHASKGAIVSFTRDLAVKWGAYNINVNVLCPGFFPTDISHTMIDKGIEDGTMTYIPMGRVGGDEDLKGVAVFFSSDASNYLTGAILFVDGGLSAA